MIKIKIIKKKGEKVKRYSGEAKLDK